MLFFIKMALFICYRDQYKLYTKNVETKEWIIFSMVLLMMIKTLLKMSILLFIGIKWKHFQKCQNQIILYHKKGY